MKALCRIYPGESDRRIYECKDGWRRKALPCLVPRCCDSKEKEQQRQAFLQAACCTLHHKETWLLVLLQQDNNFRSAWKFFEPGTFYLLVDIQRNKIMLLTRGMIIMAASGNVIIRECRQVVHPTHNNDQCCQIGGKIQKTLVGITSQNKF